MEAGTRGHKKNMEKTGEKRIEATFETPRMTFKKWEQDWFDICKETAADRHQWRDVVAGKGQHCPEKP